MKIEIYSDVACPWCYIGKRRFEQALEQFEESDTVEAVFRPYQLDPGAPRPGRPMREYLEQRFGGRADGMIGGVVDSALREGIEMDYGRGIAANTFDAHRLMRLAEREHGADVQRAVAERLFERHFAGGADISDLDVLVEIGTAAGLDAARVREYLASDEGGEELRRELEDARQLGIAAVPTFVIDGRYAVQGAQPPSALVQALQQAARAAS